MPCRSDAPLVAIRKPAPARWPTTVGPDQPGRGVHGDADGLVDHHDRVVVVDDLDPLDDLGHDRERVGLDRDRHVEDRAGQHPVALRRRPRRRAATCPCGDQVGRAGAGQAEQPGHGGVDALAGQPFRDREDPVVGAAGHCCASGAGSASRRGVRVPSRWMPRNDLDQDQHRGDVDADVGDVEDRPVRQHEEVDDVAAQRRRARGAAGRSGCRRRRPAAGRARPPSRAAEPAGQVAGSRTTAAIATQVRTSVYAVPVLNAAPGLRTRCSTRRSPTSSTSGPSVRCSTARILETTSTAYAVDARPAAKSASSRAPGAAGSGRVGRPVRRVAGQRRSSRCLHVMHSVARGKAISRILPIGLPQDSQTP